MPVLTGPAEAPFALAFPENWEPVDDYPLDRQDEQPPAVVLKRSDDRGVVTLTIKGPLRTSLDELGSELHAALAARFPDFQLLSSRTLAVRAGEGLYSTWLLRDGGQVQAHLVVPGGDHTYLIEGMMPAGATDVPEEVGSIFTAFDLRPPA